jgi:SAM-dependent methyltransferase
MDSSEYQRMFELEDKLWWFLGMRRISRALLDKYLPVSVGNRSILDMGCGTGGMLATLGDYGKTFAADASEIALRLACERGDTPLVQADVCRLPFASESFDLVTCFDVLYHLRVASDREALLEIARVLRPDGLVLLRVPALNLMRGRHDVAVHTRQRYEKREIVQKLTHAGLSTEFVSYANFFMLPLAIIRRTADRWLRPRHHGSEVEPVPPWINWPLLQFLALESKWMRNVPIPLPIGLSLVAVARKRLPIGTAPEGSLR